MADFLEKLKKGVNDGATIASMKSKNLIEITKIKTQISTLESKMKDQIEELGTHYYRGYSAKELESEKVQVTLNTVCEAISTIDESIQAKEQTIKTIQMEEEALVNSMKIITCQCGEPIKPGTLFCKHCGTKVETNVGAQTANKDASTFAEIHCQCGKAVKEGMRFCGGCGKNVAGLFEKSQPKEEMSNATE